MAELFFKNRRGGRKNLRDFTRLGLAFYAGLLLISCYQQIRLFSQGILDSLFNTNLLLATLHHLGFAAILALVLSFGFNALEARKPQLGAQVSVMVFLGVLGLEFLLTEYFVTQYKVPAPGIPGSFGTPPKYLWLRLLLGFSVLSAGFYLVYKRSRGLQLWISRMYPFTIVLFSMFLATLLSDKRPVNQNKTEGILISLFNRSETSGTRMAEAHSLYGIPPVSPRDMIYIHSVFSGDDFDRAYRIARGLAHDGQPGRAMSLTSHILWEVPGHVDAEILMGRLLSWEESFGTSAEILGQVVRDHPAYEDGYAALLDTYFWSGQHHKALRMQPLIEEHLGGSGLLEAKLERSRSALLEAGVTKAEPAGIFGNQKRDQP
jgi:hypothetical protein